MLHINKITIVSILLLILLSCIKEEPNIQPPKLSSCGASYMLYSENLTRILDPEIFYPPDTSTPTFSYEYDNYNIKRITGGFIPMYSHDDRFSRNAYDSITKESNSIYVHHKYLFEDTIIEKINSPEIYEVDGQNRIVKITKEAPSPYSGMIDLFYEYSDNEIIETDENGDTRRTYYFENENLTKIITEYEYPDGIILIKNEIIFQGYDDKPNPFYGYYHILGAYFRSFSKNNYTAFTVNRYKLMDDGSYELIETIDREIPLSYNANGYPMFGDYE